MSAAGNDEPSQADLAAQAAAAGLGDEVFQAVFTMAPFGMCLLGLDGRFLAANPVFCRMLGYTEREMATQGIAEVTHPGDVARSGGYIRQVLTSPGTILEIEKRYLHRDGRVVWAAVRTHLVQRPDGSPRFFITHVEDITKRRLEEETLRASEEKFRIAFENAPTGMCMIGPDGRYLAANPALCQMLGYTMAELLQLDIETVTHPEDIERGRSWLRKLHAEDLTELEHEKRYLHRDGHVVWGVVRARWIRHIDGELRFSVAHVTDISERKRASEERARLEEQLRQSQKIGAIGLLAGGVAHDFNNLLTVICGNAAIALGDLDPGHSVGPLLEEITRAGESAASLTRQLLAFSRKEVIAPRVLCLNQVVGQMQKMFRRLLGEEIELVTHCDPGLGRARIDLGQIEQVLVNLAVNARDAMTTGGRLTLATANVSVDEASAGEYPGVAAGDYVVLRVADTGAGMSEEVKAHLFEPFFTTKGKGHGTGLGLAMVHGAVRQNQGHVVVLSEAGRGTVFQLLFPRVRDPLDNVPAGARPTLVRGTETILLVEDDEMVRAVGLHLLRQAGYSVRAFADGPSALGALSAIEEPVHLLLTDVIMPGMDGHALAARAKALRPAIKVLYVSGYPHDIIAQHGVVDEGIAFLAKPYTIAQLAARVREVLDAVAPEEVVAAGEPG